MELYDAPPGYSDPDVPEGYSDPSKQKSGLAKLWEHAKKKDAEIRSKPMKDRILSMIGNSTVGGVPDLKQLSDLLPEDWTTARGAIDTVNSVLPSQSVAGITKGASDLVLGPAQLASHATGIGKKSVDLAVNATSDYYKKNFNKSTSGEIAGQALTTLLPGSSASKLLTIAKSAAAPLAFTPETNLKDDSDYWSRKGTEALVGGALGAAIPLVGSAVRPVARGINNLKDRLASAGSVAETQGNLSQNFGGKSAGKYLQDKAIEVYEAPLAKHDALMAQVGADAPNATTGYKNTLAALDEIISDYNNNVSKMRPEQIQQIQELRDNISKAVQPQATSTSVNSVNAYLNNAPAIVTETTNPTISNDLAGLIRAYQDFGKPLGKNIAGHGDRLSRGTLQDIRYAMLQDAHEASPDLAGNWGQAREVFKNEVVPLFDKKQGGGILTQIRDAWDPDDQLQKLLQGGLRDAKVNKIGKVASGAASDPLIWQAIENATQGAHGRPGAFASSLEKALPSMEAISTPEQAKQIKDLIFQAKASQVLGIGANATAMAAASAVPGVGPAIAGGIGLGSHYAPALSGQGLTWKALQSPRVREMLSKAWNIPTGSPEFDAKLAQFIAQQTGRSQQPSPDQ